MLNQHLWVHFSKSTLLQFGVLDATDDFIDLDDLVDFVDLGHFGDLGGLVD